MFPRGGSLQLTAPIGLDNTNQGLFSTCDEGNQSGRKKRNASSGVGDRKRVPGNSRVDVGESLFSTASETPSSSKRLRAGASKAGNDSHGLNRKKKAAENDSNRFDLNERTEQRIKSAFSLRNPNSETVVLGAVTRVGDKSAQVTLPGGIIGEIAFKDLSDEHAENLDGVEKSLKDYLWRGKEVICAVLPASGRKIVRLSLAASKVNRPAVVSHSTKGSYVYGTIHCVEDHGYSVNIGHESIASVFMKFSADEKADEGRRLKVGSSIFAVVLSRKGSAKQKAVIQVNRVNDDVEVLKNSVKLDQLLPGMRVRGTFVRRLRDGMAVRFLGCYSGTVDRFHLDSWEFNSAESKKIVDGEKEKDLKILFVDYENKKIALSAASVRDKTKDGRIFDEVVGKVFDKAKVVYIDESDGVLLHIPVEDGSDEYLKGYARRSRRDDVAVVEVDEKVKPGQEKPCRVLAYSPMDNILKVSLSKSVVEAPVVNLEDLIVGARVRAKVVRVGDNGLIMSLAKDIGGRIPNRHLSDVVVSDVQSRFKPGQYLDVRILDMKEDDNGRPHIVLTNKRSLVSSELPLITKFDDATPGLISHGVVSGSNEEKGLFFTFFGNVSGKVENADLLALGISNPAEIYKVGSVHKVKISRVSKEKHQIVISIRTAIGAARLPASGSRVSAKIFRKDQKALYVKVGADGAVGTITAEHLSDFVPSQRSTALYKKKSILDDVIVLNDELGTLTLKPALVEASLHGNVPVSKDSFVKGSTIVGFVSSVNITLGVFVSFFGNLVALAPRSHVSDAFTTKIDEYFVPGQTVLCTVCDVDIDKHRYIVSLKPSALKIPQYIHRTYLSSLMTPVQNEHIFIGMFTEAKVVQIVNDRVKLAFVSKNVAESLEGRCLLSQQQVDLKPGQKVVCRILDTCLDDNVKVADVIVYQTNPVEDLWSKSERLHTEKVKKLLETAPSRIPAVVHLVKDKYAVLSIFDYQIVAFAPVSSFNGPIFGLEKLACGVSCSVQLLENCGCYALTSIFTDSLKHRSRSRSSSLELLGLNQTIAKQSIDIGSKIDGRIRSVKPPWVSVTISCTRYDPANAAPERLHGQLHVTDIFSPTDKDVGRVAFDTLKTDEVMTDLRVSRFERKVDVKGRAVTNVILSRLNEDLILDNLKTGDIKFGFVDRVSADGVYIALSRHVRGFCHCTHVSSDVEMLNEVFNKGNTDKLPAGMVVKVAVIEMNETKERVYLSMMLS